MVPIKPEWLYMLLRDDPEFVSSMRRVVEYARENWPTVDHAEWVVGNHCRDMLRVRVVADHSADLTKELALSGIASMDRDAVGRYWLGFFRLDSDDPK